MPPDDKIMKFQRATTAWEEGVSSIARLYGVSPLAGRLWAILFLATEPMSLEALCTATGAAKSSVSVALRGLAKARVARRLPPRPDRRDYYEAVSDPWQMLADWNRLYFQPEIAMFRASGDQLESALADDPEAPRGDAADELRRRIGAMRDLCEVFEDMFGRLERSRSAPRAARPIAIRIDSEEEP
jgi:DNA-binding transcriptional regulator GbsR (MarR family)